MDLYTQRTHYCGELRRDDIGDDVVLTGWVHSSRDHGGVIFLDLRDRDGLAQVVCDPSVDTNIHALGHTLRSEWVIAVKGRVRERPEGTINPNLPSGEVEVVASELDVLSESEVIPFQIEDEANVSEEIRLTHRYLDMRRPDMLHRLRLRHKAAQVTRRFLDERGFVDVETPLLLASTPEGARDFLVPSRLHQGQFYALPQSPQILKQILMVGGLDKYYQIVKCLRDEDLRADRQPEFTQIDIEMSFVDEQTVIGVMDELVAALFRECIGVELDPPFARMAHADAVGKYGTDRPDVRYGLELVDLTQEMGASGVKVFQQAVERGGIVKALHLPGGADMSRKDIDDLTDDLKQFGSKGLAWIKIADEWQSPIVKFMTDDDKAAITDKIKPVTGDIVFFQADGAHVVNQSMDYLRRALIHTRDIEPDGEWGVTWVTDFPLVEWNDDDKRWDAMHHPFTSPRPEDLDKLEDDIGSVRARAYDLVINGYEVGGGSMRIHRSDVQTRVFKALGVSEQEAQEKFGFLLKALNFGAPPMGGIAFGFDRLVMLLAGQDNIREVIPFPKTQKGYCLLTNAPGPADPMQLRELGLKTAAPKE